MKIRSFPFYVMTVLFLSSLVVVPAVAAAGDTNSFTNRVMSDSNSNPASGSPKKDVQVTNAEKKKSEVQISLGDELKAYISAGESPYGKDLNGKPFRGNYRTTFGFHIPL